MCSWSNIAYSSHGNIAKTYVRSSGIYIFCTFLSLWHGTPQSLDMWQGPSIHQQWHFPPNVRWPEVNYRSPVLPNRVLEDKQGLEVVRNVIRILCTLIRITTMKVEYWGENVYACMQCFSISPFSSWFSICLLACLPFPCSLVCRPSSLPACFLVCLRAWSYYRCWRQNKQAPPSS